MNYQEIHNNILTWGNYLTLATIDFDGFPWISPLVYQYQKNTQKIFFVSNPDSLHIKNITKNPHIAFSVVDARDHANNAIGVQGKGFVREIPSDEISSSIRSDLLSKVAIVVLNREYSFYEITITESYLPNPERWKENANFRIRVI